MCTSTAQAHEVWGPAAGASSDCALVVVPCAFWYMVVTFRGRCKGKVQGIGAVLLRNAVFVDVGDRRGAQIS